MTETPDHRAGEPAPQPVEPTAPADGTPADAAPPPSAAAADPTPGTEPDTGAQHTTASASASPAEGVGPAAVEPSDAASAQRAPESAAEPTTVLPAANPAQQEHESAGTPAPAIGEQPAAPVQGTIPAGMQPPAGQQYPGTYPGGFYPGAYGAPGPWGSPVPPVWAGGPQAPYGEADPQAAKPKRGPGRMLLAVALIAGLVGGGLGAGLVYAFSGGTTVAPVAETDGSDGGNGLSTSSPNANQITAAAAKVLPSVVTITVTEPNGDGDQGSGIIISSTGEILTNNHVVSAGEQSGTSIAVTFASGKMTPAKILGTDPSSDLAVIKASGVSGLPVATLGDSNSLAVGQTVVAIGAPLGLSNTVTSGIVSALNRPIFPTSDDSSPSSSTTANQPVLDAIQTDAAINPGNSGGPLVNLQGQVIGIDSAILTAGSDTLGGSSQSGSIGLGFAIPISQAEWIYPELISTGSATHSLLGVEVTDPSASATQTGAVVNSVSSGGPAAKAGLKPGDVITSLNNQQISSSDALVAAVRSYKPGTTVTLTYLRSGNSATAQVTLATASSSNS